MKIRLLLIPLIAVLFCGCAYLRSTTKDPVFTAVGTNSVLVGYKRTTVRAYTFFDSQSALSKFRNTTGAVGTNGYIFAPGTSIGNLDTASSGTNFNDLIGTIVGAAVGAAKKP